MTPRERLPRVVQLQSAARRRAAGNGAFAQRSFPEAAAFYASALSMLDAPGAAPRERGSEGGQAEGAAAGDGDGGGGVAPSVDSGGGHAADAVDRSGADGDVADGDVADGAGGAESVEVEEQRVACLLNLAAALLAAGDAAGARGACDRVLTRRPGNLKALFRRAKAAQLGNSPARPCALPRSSHPLLCVSRFQLRA